MPTWQFTSISTGTLVRFVAVILGVYVLYLIGDILAALFLAVIIASAVEPAVEWLKERSVPRLLGVILVYLLIGVVFFIAVYFILPVLVQDLQQVVTKSYPRLERDVLTALRQLGAISTTTEFRGYLKEFRTNIIDFISAIFGGVLSAFLVVVFSFYLAAQEKGIESFIRLVSPLEYETYILGLWRRSQRKLGRWLRSQLLLGALVGVMIFIGLTLLGVERAFFFALLVGIFELVPVVGPILAAIPAVATAFLSDPRLGLLVIGLYVVVQQLESNVIVPVIMRRNLGLNPLVVVVALIVGAKLGGILGIILAIPITAIGAELVDDWDKKKRSLLVTE